MRKGGTGTCLKVVWNRRWWTYRVGTCLAAASILGRHSIFGRPTPPEFAAQQRLSRLIGSSQMKRHKRVYERFQLKTVLTCLVLKGQHRELKLPICSVRRSGIAALPLSNQLQNLHLISKKSIRYGHRYIGIGPSTMSSQIGLLNVLSHTINALLD